MEVITVFEREPDVQAKIRFNNVRTRAVSNGYRPGHRITDDYITTGVHNYYDVDLVFPGETVSGTITFITPEEYPHTLYVGKEIDICEGELIVGSALITKIFNNLLEAFDNQL